MRLLLALLCLILPAHAAEPLLLARGGRATGTIVVADSASKVERSAAAELAAYLEKITGAAFPVRTAREKPQGTLVLVGRGPGATVDDLGPEGFRIRTRDGNVLLTGADDDGTEFAVYTFLEKYLGVRWLWPGELGEVVPRRSTVALEPIDDAQKPDFLWRDRGPGGALWGATNGPTEMHARALLLGVTEKHQRQVRLWERHNKWGGWKVYGGHSLGEIFPPEKYARTHPEFYALVNGKREVPGPDYDYKHRGQVCTTNPAVVETAAEWVNQFFDAHPDYRAVHITMNDSSGFCECDRCRSLVSGRVMQRKGIDAEEAKGGAARNTVITDRIFTFVNQVSERVQKRHPGKYVVSMAYARYILPPERIQLHPFAIPQYCLWSAYRHANPETKREQESIAAGWARAARMAGIYEYYINGSWPGLHRLVVPQIAESIRHLRRQGIRLYQTQSGDEFATNGINYYVAGKLLWDASADESKILDDFYAMGFGRAALAVRRFHARLEKAWADATRDGRDVSCNSLESTRLGELFTPELLRASAADLDDAATAAENATVRQRVEFYRKGLRFTELTVDAVRTARAVDLRSEPGAMGPEERARLRRLVSAALEACRRRQRFVEVVKNDYVLPYFWVRYNDEQRAEFLPVARLEALLTASAPASPPQRRLSREQEERWRSQIKATLFVPDPLPPLAAETHGRFEPEAGVIAERITYGTQFGMRVTAVLYRPKALKGKIPGMVVVNGHGGDKYSWYSFYSGIVYARAGAAVLTYDPAGEGERNIGRQSGTRAHDKVEPPPELARRLAGLMMTDLMQAVSYVSQRPEVDPRRIAAAGYSLGSFVVAMTGAVDTRMHACVLVGGGNLDGPGEYWDGAKPMCVGTPWRSLMVLGDRPAVIYTLHASRGPTLIFNGTADNVVAIPTHLEPFFAELRKRIAEVRGSAEGIFETGWEPGASHRPFFVTKPVALWLERQLGFPNWTETGIRAMAETHVSEWAKANQVEMDPRYSSEQREGGTRALGTGVPGLSREALSVFSAEEWDKQKSRMIHETWLQEAKSRIAPRN